MKKLVTLFSLLLLCGMAKAQFTGSGTSGDPYQITTAADLASLATNVNAGTAYSGFYFKLMNDINLSGYSDWTPIGNNVHVFMGKFDGNSHKIIGLTISGTSEYSGLFGYISYGCAIKNLTIENCNITTTGVIVGALVGFVNLNTSNQSVTIDNCHSSGSLTGSGTVGGLIGTVVQSSPATGGNTYSIIISNCSSSVTVVLSTNYYNSAGGLVGEFLGELDMMTSSPTRPQLKYCYATGSVSSPGTSELGGLVGKTNWATISNCYATGNVSNTDTSGGLMGALANSIMSNCYSTGQITGSSAWIHGFIGDGYGTITDCFWDKDTSGKTIDDLATPKTTAQMKTQTTYTDAGWDFSTPIWKIDATTNNGYPFLVLQASELAFSTVQATQMTIGWTNGNGTSRAVFVKAANTGTAAPADNTTYTANATFASGTQISSTGWYCIYNGTGSSVTVTGLTGGTDYIVQVFEYNGTAGAEKYYAGTATNNPKSQTTAMAAPTVTSISPASGTTGGGTTVTITGANLTGATAVNFGGTAGSITANTATSITVTSPAGSAGTVHITVVTAGGTSATSASDQFTYLPNDISGYNFTIANDAQVSDNILEFDLFLLDINLTEQFELAAVQAGILIDPTIYSGGSITASVIAGSSQLN